MSVEQSEEKEKAVLAEEEEAVPLVKKELPAQKLPELENVTELEEPAGQKATAEGEEVAKPKGRPRQEKTPAVKDEL